ncbi:response regulator transcription factor [Massilia sp. YIM B02443]|uniref:response regulator transcription factor n=1 Tax=Massilia sp. YIM B02443 TaxID=3050127 RepID=UPI0025B6A382|nr:response regulator [Massilia sp. YIM B02443]MDN4037728.1 response regulator [Massilia sp. YIM B02443]
MTGKLNRILVVDDQQDLRLLIRLSLRALGEVAQAASAESALALLHEKAPDLLILDVWLGEGISGLALCRQIKDDPRTAGVKIVLLSACGQQSDIAAGMAAGADYYMVKPFSPEVLLEAAKGLLEG